MLPPEPAVIAARYGFADAQLELTGGPRFIGYYKATWYGTSVDDERGSFAVVNPQGPLVSLVGDLLQLALGGHVVNVYVIGSYNGLLGDVGLTRRAYLALSPLAIDPITLTVAMIS